MPLNLECNDRRKKIIPNTVQTKYTRASYLAIIGMPNLNTQILPERWDQKINVNYERESP